MYLVSLTGLLLANNNRRIWILVVIYKMSYRTIGGMMGKGNPFFLFSHFFLFVFYCLYFQQFVFAFEFIVFNHKIGLGESFSGFLFCLALFTYLDLVQVSPKDSHNAISFGVRWPFRKSVVSFERSGLRTDLANSGPPQLLTIWITNKKSQMRISNNLTWVKCLEDKFLGLYRQFLT